MGRDDRTRWEARYGEHAARSAEREISPFVRSAASVLGGRVLDAAAGAGRHALYLARRGAVVHAIDIARGGLAAVADAARSESLPVHCLQADLEQYPIRADHYDAAVVVRYLQRSLFPKLRRAVRPGGVVLVETFLIDQRRLGHPRNPAFLLQRGELATAFAGFEIVTLEEDLVRGPTGDEYLGRILARRPEPGGVSG